MITVYVDRIEGRVPVLVPVDEIESVDRGEFSALTAIQFKSGGRIFTSDGVGDILHRVKNEVWEM